MVSAMLLLLSVGNVKCHTKFNKENHLISSEVERGHTRAHACMYARTRVHVNIHTHTETTWWFQKPTFSASLQNILQKQNNSCKNTELDKLLVIMALIVTKI